MAGKLGMRTETSESVSMISVFQKTVKFTGYHSSLFYSLPNLWLPCFNSLYFSLFFPPLVYFILQIFVSPSYLHSYSSSVVFSTFPYLCFNVRCLFYLPLWPSLFLVCCLHFSLPYSITYSFLTSLVSPTLPDSVLSQYKQSLRRPLLGNKLPQAQ